jgi:hypothetical protein
MWQWQPTGGWSWEFPPMRAKLSDKPRKKGDDGDTVLMVVDRSMNDHAEEPIRLVGVRAAESWQNGGEEIARFTALVFDEVVERATAHRQRWPFVVVTEPVFGLESSQRRTLTRYAGTVYAMDTGECLNRAIIDFVKAHPEWGPGTGSAKDAHANG